MKHSNLPLSFNILSRRFLLCLFSCILLCCATVVSAQEKKDSVIVKADSTIVVTAIKNDSTGKDSIVKKRVFSPRAAAIRSAVLPGWGQIYNRKYWKLPIVYAALGITGYIFFDNLKTYKEYRFAYSARYKAQLAPDFDSTDFKKLAPIYQNPNINIETIKSGRDRFRQYIDYSVLFFVVFWGLNVVDATVDAHLKGFDVSPDLTLKIKPGHSAMAGTNGISLVLSFRDRHGR